MIKAQSDTIRTNGTEAMKYGTIRLQKDQYERLYRYIATRSHEKSGRFTANDAVKELLDAKGAE